MVPADGAFEDLAATSTRAILANQKSNGAFLASPDFAQYQYCWLRDGSFIAYALDRVGVYDASERFHRWSATAVDRIAELMDAAIERARLGKPVDPDAMPPARFNLDGFVVSDGWPNFQIDGYGTWLWSLREHVQRSGASGLSDDLVPAVKRTARYLAEIGTAPCFDVWEEGGDAVHTSTLGCVYAGLTAASTMLADSGLRASAESIRSSVLERAREVGRFEKSDRSDQVDAALLWLSEPFGLCAPNEPAYLVTASEVAAQLDFEGGIRRYPSDTYYGGGAWPVLTASLGWHLAVIGDIDEATSRQRWVAEKFDEAGHLGEQFGGDRRHPEMHAEWVRRWGPSAAELLWSHAMFVVLCDELDVNSPLLARRDEPTVLH